MHNKNNYELDIILFRNKNENDPNFPNNYYPINEDTLLSMQNKINEYGQLIQDDLREDEETLSNLTTSSLGEHFTGRYWHDGRKIYACLIDFGTLPNTSSKEVATGIENIEHLTCPISGWTYKDNSIDSIPLPFVSTAGSQYFIDLSLTNDNKVRIRTGSDRTDMKAYVTLEYTKTTDEVVINE